MVTSQDINAIMQRKVFDNGWEMTRTEQTQTSEWGSTVFVEQNEREEEGRMFDSSRHGDLKCS